MITIVHNGHVIKIKAFSFFTGKETIWYDEKVVSTKHSIAGSTHIFNVEEEKTVQYEVEIGARSFGCYVTVRRDGKLIYSDR